MLDLVLLNSLLLLKDPIPVEALWVMSEFSVA